MSEDALLNRLYSVGLLEHEELELLHIRASGQVQSESDLEAVENPVDEAQQLSLVDSGRHRGI